MADLSQMREEAKRLFRVAVDAADPDKAVGQFATTTGFAEPADGRTVVLAFGKAAPAMARAALRYLPKETTALVVTHHENAQSVNGATVITAGHPVPDAAGAHAAQTLIDIIAPLTEADHVLALVSGGASALLPAPAEGLSLEDKQALNTALLASGLDIVQMNLVRQQASQLKGGGLVRLAHPAKVQALILSDVIGDDLRAIASGPTVAPLGTRTEAKHILENANAFSGLPDHLQAHFSMHERPLETPTADNILIGSNRVSLNAMQTACAGTIVSDALVGDVDDAAHDIAAHAQSAAPGIYLFGGETTVVLKGNGTGGRNQELAARVAMKLRHLERPWAFLSGGTDGRDGPTDAAGGIVDGGTWTRAAHVGPDALLANNDSYALLKSADDLLMTDATGTNVADVQVLILG